MTLIVALCLLVTQISPPGAMARDRGAPPTVISATSRVRCGFENTDRVVVLVHDPQSVSTVARSSMTRLLDIEAGWQSAADARSTMVVSCGPARVAGRDGHVVDAGLRERVGDRRRGRVRRLRSAIVEIPLVLDTVPPVTLASNVISSPRSPAPAAGADSRRRADLRQGPREALAVAVDAVACRRDDIERARDRRRARDQAVDGSIDRRTAGRSR